MQTGTTSITYEDGERVYPCRCGETHRGDYAVYYYGHHNCFHEELTKLEKVGGIEQVICPQCGKVWEIKGE